MADFSMFSDSDEDKQVEELLSQAMDDSILQQISAINCSGFIDDSVLPTHLQTRFNNLKSGGKPPLFNSHKNTQFHKKKEEQQHPDDDDDDSIAQNTKSELGSSKESEEGLESKSESRNIELKERKSESGENAIFSPGKKRFSKKESGEFEFRLSPTKRVGCFWCSPKRVFSKKSKGGEGDGGVSVVDWEKDDDFSTTFSTKGPEKLWKKLMREEEKINREAEKIVKWAKQASATMEVEGLDDNDDADDELSDT